MSTSKAVVKGYGEIMQTYDPSANKTSCRMTKYEKTQIIGVRMEQLARSGKAYVTIDPNETFDPYTVAMKEFDQDKLPFLLRRTLPNGEKEYWRLEDMVKC
jgi:DNA-directed RNA polymerase I, II, and III subunit RPABC2